MRTLPIALLVFLAPTVVWADAVIRTQAMLASTIAEVFVREGRIDVELEIAARDLPAFRNLLPDDVYERLGHDPEPLAARLARFITEDLAFLDDEGDPLRGRLIEIAPRTRVRRDEITGEPLAAGDGDEETVVFARLIYEMPDRPVSLTIAAPRLTAAASVGWPNRVYTAAPRALS